MLTVLRPYNKVTCSRLGDKEDFLWDKAFESSVGKGRSGESRESQIGIAL